MKVGRSLALLSVLCLRVAQAEDEDSEEVISLVQVHTKLQPTEAGAGSGSGGPLLMGSRDIIHHLHIPKVAGMSFMNDALDAVRPHNLMIFSQEGCIALPKSDPRVLGAAMLIRKPRSHVLSQFEYCTAPHVTLYTAAVRQPGEPAFPASFEVWLRQWKSLKDGGWHGDFTPPAFPDLTGSLIATAIMNQRMDAWSRPPFTPAPTQHNFTADWAHADGGGTLWHFTEVLYNCYVPISMQAQRLSCRMPMDYSVLPSADLAVSNMKGSWFVGLVEAYQASMCLFRVKLGEPLPSYCNCKDPQSWNSYPATERNVNHRGRSLSDYSPEVLRLVDDLTEADRKVYDAARVRFVSEIRQVEKTFNTTVLCDESALLL